MKKKSKAKKVTKAPMKSSNAMQNHNFRVKPMWISLMRFISGEVKVPVSRLIRDGSLEYAQRLYQEHRGKTT